MKFPQPIRTKDPLVNSLWYTNEFGEVANRSFNWTLTEKGDLNGHDSDLYDRLIVCGKYYNNRDDAILRRQYDGLELLKVRIPLWIDITKEYEYKGRDDEWYDLNFYNRVHNQPKEWNNLTPDKVRLKPKSVVVELNGVTYSWPATVTEADNTCPRYHVSSKELDIKYYLSVACHGTNTHFSRTGAEAQLRFFKAVNAAMAGTK